MSKYGMIEPEVFEEPEYRDTQELLLAIYFMTNRDIAGVCKCVPRIIAPQCRTTTRKVESVVNYFAGIGKLVIAENRSHIWWKSAINYSLYKGKYSLTQLSSVSGLLFKWHCSKIFGENFFEEVAQLYARQYSIVIPYPKGADTLSDQSYTQSYTQSQSQVPVEAPDVSSHKMIVDYFCIKYQKAIGEKYDFRKKDAKLIHDLLKIWTPEKLKSMIDTMFNCQDKFINESARTIGVLSSCSNKLAQLTNKNHGVKNYGQSGEINF